MNERTVGCGLLVLALGLVLLVLLVILTSGEAR